MSNLNQIITVNPEQCGGLPCIRGMRIRVIDVLELMSNGLTKEEILEELPDLTMSDVLACLKYATERLAHPVVKVA